MNDLNPFERYAATESLDSILNGLVALCSREELNESESSNPDTQRIEELKLLKAEVLKVRNDSRNFMVTEDMQRLIAIYSPIFLAQQKKCR